MIWYTSRHAFAALNPPDWLQHDLTVAEAQTALHRMKTLVLFADQLPLWGQQSKTKIGPYPLRDRKRALDAIVQEVFGCSLKKSRLAPTLATVRECHADVDSGAVDGAVVHELSGLPFRQRSYQQRPALALVVLADRHYSFSQMVAFRLQVPRFELAPTLRDESFQQFVLWHELGHVWRALCRPRPLNDYDEEFLCDRFSIRGCLKAGHPEAAVLLRHYRALSALTAPIKPPLIQYWNTLRLYDPTHSFATNMHAQMEVKARAVGFPDALVHEEPRTLFWLMNGSCSRELRTIYKAGRAMVPLVKAIVASERHYPYQSGLTARLASYTIRAAQAMVPGILD